MKGPSIAVMLAGKPSHDEGDSGEPGADEAKSSALDASKALMHAVASRDPEGIYRAFRSLCTLCKQMDDLEDSGEGEDKEKDEYAEDEAGSDKE